MSNTTQNNTLSSPESQHPTPPHQIKTLTIRQAIQIARLAVASILFGDPPQETFDRDDLAQTLAILSQMAGTIAPAEGS